MEQTTERATVDCACGECKNTTSWRLERQGFRDQLLSWLGWFPWECRRCRTRFYVRRRE